MNTKDLLIFTAIVTVIIVGVTIVGWIYFLKWSRAESQARQERLARVKKADDKPQ